MKTPKACIHVGAYSNGSLSLYVMYILYTCANISYLRSSKTFIIIICAADVQFICMVWFGMARISVENCEYVAKHSLGLKWCIYSERFASFSIFYLCKMGQMHLRKVNKTSKCESWSKLWLYFYFWRYCTSQTNDWCIFFTEFWYKILSFFLLTFYTISRNAFKFHSWIFKLYWMKFL